MSLEMALFIIIAFAVIAFEVLDTRSEIDQDKKIDNLDDHQQWQDNEYERLRERTVALEKQLADLMDMYKEFKNEIIKHRRSINDFLLQQRLEREAAKDETAVEPENVLDHFALRKWTRYNQETLNEPTTRRRSR